ncbi:uncharacterized protein LOC128963716 [Oppia nitens]|uniref:uncharacterized protein LOC128963716 n=1 Tax=Oppia nitens TaxID=1686743 RepID=UPI0023DCB3AD|nr:uncharacterized protein LOC128963716 [Oppia nitens]
MSKIKIKTTRILPEPIDELITEPPVQRRRPSTETLVAKVLKYQGGFIGYWTRNYGQALRERDRSFYPRLWRAYMWFKFLMLFRILKCFSVLLDQPVIDRHARIHVYLGTFSLYMGGPALYTEIVALSWTVSVFILYHYCVCRPVTEFSWLTVFNYLNRDNIQVDAIH